MKQSWWKWLGVILVLYTVVGGLWIPLKTGITGLKIDNGDSLNIHTGSTSTLFIDIYNPDKNFKPSSVVLQNGSKQFVAEKAEWDGKGIVTATFKPLFGKNESSESIYNLYVKSGKQWMSLPNALGIKAGKGDTLLGNSVVLNENEIKGEPDKLKGFPNRIILYESIRNLFYHVPMWFAMIFLLSLSAWYAMRYLKKENIDYDLRSHALVQVAVLCGFMGCTTGSVWASVTWDTWWPREDPKMNGVAIGMIMYLAYMLLRSGIKDEHQKGRVAAVYNLFVYPVFIALIAIMPKLAGESLHPGAGGTVTFKQYDLDSTMRLFFYPAIIGWICIFSWMGSLLYRYKKLEYQNNGGN